MFPNGVRRRREEALLTRGQLAELSTRAVETDPILYAAISVRSLERLERGEVQPRSRTAVTVAYVLGRSVSDLFPEGVADFNRNPGGRNSPPDGTDPGRSI